MIARVNTLKPIVSVRIAGFARPWWIDLKLTAAMTTDARSIPRRIPG